MTYHIAMIKTRIGATQASKIPSSVLITIKLA